MYIAAAITRGAHEVLDVERRLAKELVAALLANHGEAALDGADGGRCHVAVFGGDFLAALSEVGQQGADRSLRSSSSRPSSSAMRKAMLSAPSCASVKPMTRDSMSGPISLTGGANGVALLAEQVPEDCRRGLKIHSRRSQSSWRVRRGSRAACLPARCLRDRPSRQLRKQERRQLAEPFRKESAASRSCRFRLHR